MAVDLRVCVVELEMTQGRRKEGMEQRKVGFDDLTGLVLFYNV